MDHKTHETKSVQEQIHCNRLSQPQIQKPGSLHQVENYRTAVKESLETDINLDINTNHLARWLQDVIVNSATTAFGMKKLRTTRNFPVNTWYDEECKTMRKNLQNALRTNDPKAKQYQKQYKSLVKAKKAQYNLEQSELLCKQAKEDPTGFWNKLRGQKPQNINSITDEEWVAAFKRLLGSEPSHNGSSDGIDTISPENSSHCCDGM